MLASYPIRMARDALQDDGAVRWSLDDLIDYLNAAQYALVSVRPDAKSTIAAVQLASGTRQAIPSGGIRLLNVTRNMGADGVTPGKVVTLAQRNSFDLNRPGWHTDTAKTAIRHFFFDNRHPKDFYVWPPVHATIAVYVEMMYSVEPAMMPLSTDAPAYDAYEDVIDVSGIFVNPLLEFMLYRAYQKDAETANAMLASQHLQLFYSQLGIDSAKAALHSQENRDRPYSPMETSAVGV